MTLRGRLGYFLAWAAVAAAVWLYVDRREVMARYRAYQENDAAVNSTAEETARLGEEVAETQQRVKNLHNNPLEIESAIRRAKGLARPGEIVYRIQDDKANATNPGLPLGETPDAGEVEPQSNALEAINPDMELLP